MAKKDEWDAHPLGGASVFPVTNIRTTTAMQGTAGVIRVEYGVEPTLQKRKAQQYLLSPQQVRAFSKALEALADKLEEAGKEPLN